MAAQFGQCRAQAPLAIGVARKKPVRFQPDGQPVGGRPRQGQGEGLVGAGSAGGEEMEAGIALVGDAGRTHAALVPAMADPPLLANPRLILGPNLDRLIWMLRGDGGKVRAKLEVAPDVDDAELERLALADENVQRFVDGQPVRKVIVRAPKLVNIVV